MTATLTSTPAVVRTIAEIRAAIRAYRAEAGATASVGFVPTMGFLHEGHASLIGRSAQDNGLTVLSIFVNPLQFGPNEDFERYPRDEARDLDVAARAGADIVFMPSVSEMYPTSAATQITVSGVTERLCGASRPGHFDGVGIVVTKLFNIVQPDRAYFGLKDAQQVAVVERMVADLNQPVQIVPCPIVREADGLAMSSRNVYLSADERREALVISRTLAKVPAWIDSGMNAAQLTAAVREGISSSPIADIDYVETLTYPALQPPAPDAPVSVSDGRIIVAAAVRFGRTRLIDNILISLPEAQPL
ncbi:pantoate--beta-alanine ligase [Cohnella ginsengisoli]|uniref:Pantothenate synthetase n=1 Tax=Cohnella ginsengisoli TaxID=425004 RepID=A0A9X4KCP8_9BACL|nr:pantoate--beta-alanine ligase [Cohnella ginsengisoli]MDG0789638.1 pantoate--beta-alanine ligase [Cohnella ginsengisoli]